MSVIRPVLIALLAASLAPVHAREKPAEPPAAALHARLAQVSQDPALLKEALRRGESEAGVCRHCHGTGGNSVRPEVPNLASQNAGYLIEQMSKFVAGTRKSSDFMTGMIKALKPEERVDIALFLSAQPVLAQPVLARPAAAGPAAMAGESLYRKLCVSCHGANAAGTQKIPRLAGQQVQYLEASLKRYRAGSGERIDPMMAGYTRTLKDADIHALAAYLAALR